MHRTTSPDLNALLCALIVAPGTYSRNRFFELFESGSTRAVRRRALRIRSVIAQLTEPWPLTNGEQAPRARILGEHTLADGSIQLSYRIEDLGLTRTTTLEPLEIAALRYALHRAGRGELRSDDRQLVESALKRLCESPGAAVETPSTPPE